MRSKKIVPSKYDRETIPVRYLGVEGLLLPRLVVLVILLVSIS